MSSSSTLLAVNGTLMRGLELNENLLEAGATFIREAKTAAAYRMYSIRDEHPAMIRVNEGGAKIDLELWSLSPVGLLSVLQKEPAGLCIGKIELEDGQTVLGVLGEPILCENMREITAWGGWRAYITRDRNKLENDPTHMT